MFQTIFEGSIKYLQILDENANLDTELMPKTLNDYKIIEMYKGMLYARLVDAKMLSLQRQGRAVTYAPLMGEDMKYLIVIQDHILLYFQENR